MSNFQVRYAVLFSGSDIGQQINNALADLPSAGGRIVVASGSYSFSTQINLTTGNKNVILEGDGMGNTVLTFTGGATPAVRAGTPTSGLVTIRDLTIASSNPVAGQIGIYLNGNNNNVSVERVEIQGMGDDAIRSDNATTAIVIISECYIHANAGGYAISITAALQNFVISANEIFNNKGGINISADATGVTIRDNDIESGLNGTASLPMLNITSPSTGVLSSGNTYGMGGMSTASEVAHIATRGFVSVGDTYSLGTNTQTCLSFVGALQCTILSPILSAPATGGGIAISVDSNSKDTIIVNPTYYNTPTTRLSDAGLRTTNMSSGADAIMAFFGKQVNATGLTASIGSTALYTTNSNGSGLYRANYYLMTTTVGTGGTCSLTISWNDGNAHTTTSATISLASGTSIQSGTVILRSAASQAINYSTTVSGAAGTPQYALYLRLEEI